MRMVDGDITFEHMIECTKAMLKDVPVQNVGVSYFQRTHALMYHHAMRIIDRLVKDGYLEFSPYLDGDIKVYTWKITDIARVHVPQ